MLAWEEDRSYTLSLNDSKFLRYGRVNMPGQVHYEEMPRRTPGQGAGPTAAHVIEEVHVHNHITYLYHRFNCFQNEVGVMSLKSLIESRIIVCI